MVLLTGAAGFIGSCVLQHLLSQDVEVCIVDDFSQNLKFSNWQSKGFTKSIDRTLLFEQLPSLEQVTSIIHLGARTDTACHDWELLNTLNLAYSKRLWQYATEKDIPFLYASSAATYGDGTKGFVDHHGIVSSLEPLNLYGKSKNDFDIWALEQQDTPSRWYGFKFFNVYGANEYHKGRMASVILHTFRQIQKTGEMKLFKSHHVDYKDGEQSRDFIYVKDIVKVLDFFRTKENAPNGLYNLGTGKSRTFWDLATNVFYALGISEPKISFIDTPIDIRAKYQYFTEADVAKLSRVYKEVDEFYTLEEGIKDYVQKYLIQNIYY